MAGLSSNFFTINTMDNKSGFINLNYTGDPEKYVEGGEFSYTIHMPRLYTNNLRYTLSIPGLPS